MQFRKDINGLRAIAVIAVVLFHFNASWMPGGFAGVDVFFVISGFLMTGIIFRGIEQENFSILKFYVARANRIIPALAVLCLVLLVFGWFYLIPFDFKVLGKHVASSIGFLSNITYWRESGYFDAASQEKWLLHTWSLSAEWQFYIIYPLVLVAMRKFMSLKAMKTTVLFATVLGFIFCVIATYKWPNPAYYLLPTRAWEMMVGCVAYLYPIALKEERKKLLEWFGLVLIIASYFLISKDNPWPGYLAIFPVLGSFFIIQAQRNDSFITSNIIAQKLGTWSYSIYLWHWPLVVAIYSFSLNEIFIYIGIVLSVFLGFLSNKHIENINFKKDFSGLFTYLKCKPVYIALVIGLAGVVTLYNNGFLNRFDYIDNIAKLESNRERSESYYMQNLMNAFSNSSEPYEGSLLCTLDGGKQSTSTLINCLNDKLGQNGYLIIGDSHGRDFLHAVMLAYPNVNFAMLHESSCVPTKYKNCFKHLNKIIDKFVIGNKKLRGVIFSSLYGDDIGLQSLINDIESKVYASSPLYIINSGPRLDKSVINHAIKKSKVTDYYKLGVINNKSIKINDELSKIKNIEIFDKYSVFCEDDLCMLNDQLEPYLWDSGHLSLNGIKKLSNAIREQNFLNL